MLFESRPDAMRWLLRQHEEATRNAALVEEYRRREYAERAAIEKEEPMRAYYASLLEKPEVRVGPIDDSVYGAAFDESDHERVWIREVEVYTYEPIEVGAEVES